MADSLAKMPCDTLSERARKIVVFFFSSSRRHTRWTGDWSSDVCSSDLSQVRLEVCAATAGSARQRRIYERAGLDRKSVVYGKSVDVGGRRIIKKKK